MTAVAYAKNESAHPSADWTGLCLKFTRTAFGVAGQYATAQEAWLGAGGANGANTHTSTNLNPPANVPVFWSGGAHGYGHIAVSDGNGYVWSSDIMRKGKIDRVPISLIHKKWGLKYEGWAETLNSKRVHDHVTYPW